MSREPGIWVTSLSDSELEQQLGLLRAERVRRAEEREDPELLVSRALESGLSSSGDPLEPWVVGANGLVAMVGVVRDTSKVKHRCSLYTVTPSETDCTYWFWDEESPTHVHSTTGKVGGVRRTAAIHSLDDGSVLVRHDRVFDGESHHSRKASGYAMRTSGEDAVLEQVGARMIGRLPPPTANGASMY